jgi:hypothetical protein
MVAILEASIFAHNRFGEERLLLTLLQLRRDVMGDEKDSNKSVGPSDKSHGEQMPPPPPPPTPTPRPTFKPIETATPTRSSTPTRK